MAADVVETAHFTCAPQVSNRGSPKSSVVKKSPGLDNCPRCPTTCQVLENT